MGAGARRRSRYSGGNGGGICAARHLANRDIDVALVLSAPDRLGELPAFQRKVFASTRGREIDVVALGRDRADLIIDTLIGYSLRDAPLGRAAELIAWASHSGVPILALDVPSGVNATTGRKATRETDQPFSDASSGTARVIRVDRPRCSIREGSEVRIKSRGSPLAQLTDAFTDNRSRCFPRVRELSFCDPINKLEDRHAAVDRNFYVIDTLPSDLQ
jgi:hypothetical protein